jgi:predicted transcriptional regulator
MRRPAPPREIPPPLELECLRVLWETGEANVRTVQEALAERKLAYTTVMTLLDRLARKGAASRRKAGRAFLYSAIADRDRLRVVAIQELADAYFGGSLEELKRWLNGAPPAAEAPAHHSIDTTLL